MGYYTDYTQADSTDKTKYRWADRWAKIDVGGRNLLKNTKDFSGEWDYNGQRRKPTQWKFNGFSVIVADYMWEGLTQLVKVSAGEVYVKILCLK